MSQQNSPQTSMQRQKKEEEILRKFLSDKKLLVVDPSNSARASIMNVFIKLGAKQFNIFQAKEILEATELIDLKKPDVVVTEYNLDRHTGLELLQAQREKNPDSKKSLFILLTSNTSQSAVARAAEEEVDAFLIKPFNADTVRKVVIRAALFKINPPQYFIEIEKGKTLLMEGKLDEAQERFKEAMNLDPQPSMACYYIGQVEFVRKVLENAKGNYHKGLDYNKIHYRCMVGLYELLISMQSHFEAYEVVKRLSQYFPANPKRLSEVLRLAIMTKSYEDVEKYYSVFCNLDERNDLLINYICAALVVCGKYYLQTGNRTRALELFQKAAVTSAGRVKILKEIIQNLLEFKITGEAEKFMQRIPAEAQKTAEYKILEFLMIAATSAPAKTISLGRELISKGMVSERLYEVMVAKTAGEGRMNEAENLMMEGSDKFPVVRDKLTKIFNEGKAAHGSPKDTAKEKAA